MISIAILISYWPDRCSRELLETVFEQFVAPNSVLGLTTVVYPSGSMTEQLPTTQPTLPHILCLAEGQTKDMGKGDTNLVATQSSLHRHRAESGGRIGH
jgi:hypothetical protein